MASPAGLLSRPDARAESVEDLVARVLRGAVRIPKFQRPLVWETKHVLELFDSIYRGFPIGSLLFQRAHADADEIELGPLKFLGAELEHAWWVVDGQQRLTSLAAGLGRGAAPLHPKDPYSVYFDPVSETFVAPRSPPTAPASQWVPLPKLLNNTELSEWIFEWRHGQEAGLRRIVFEAGRRLREYRVPVYVIDTQDTKVLSDIFHRVNSAGKPLAWVDVHDALFAHKREAPTSLPELASQLETLGMGRPDEDSQLLPSLVAFAGLDVTRSFGQHVRESPDKLDGAVSEAAPALRATLSFLRVHLELPHLRLLPHSTPLPVLTRFFRLHPEPGPRTLALLARWVWRTLEDPHRDERRLRRGGVRAIDSDEEASVQRLLALAARRREPFEVEKHRFDPRSAQSRIALLGMAALRPLAFPPPRPLTADLFSRTTAGPTEEPQTGEVDVAELVREGGSEAARLLVPLTEQSGMDLDRTAANRLLLPGTGPACEEILALLRDAANLAPRILSSHAISPDVVQHLQSGDLQAALRSRAQLINDAVNALSDRLGEWERSDRPSLEYILAQMADAPAEASGQ